MNNRGLSEYKEYFKKLIDKSQPNPISAQKREVLFDLKERHQLSNQQIDEIENRIIKDKVLKSKQLIYRF